mgnify:CR=1 FL=1
MTLHATREAMGMEQILHELKHFLPAQAPLKDFVHHNTLHAFQHLPFFQGLKQAGDQFGYKVFLSLSEYRNLYREGNIKELVLKKILDEQFGDQAKVWLVKLLDETRDDFPSPKIGQFRAHWRNDDHFNLDKTIHPFLFRLLSAYLDQGISIWPFPLESRGFLDSIRQLQAGSYSSIFKSTGPNRGTHANLHARLCNIQASVSRNGMVCHSGRTVFKRSAEPINVLTSLGRTNAGFTLTSMECPANSSTMAKTC